MEIATPVGITVAFVAVLGSFVMEGGKPAAMISPPALILVFLGTLGICLASNRMSDVSAVIAATRPANGLTAIERLSRSSS